MSADERARDVVRTLERMGDRSRLEGMARFGIDTELAPSASPSPSSGVSRETSGTTTSWRRRCGHRASTRRACSRRWSTSPRWSRRPRWRRGWPTWIRGTCATGCAATSSIGRRSRWTRPSSGAPGEPEFEKRAAFALMASAAVHRKDLPDAAFASLLPVIRSAGDRRAELREEGGLVGAPTDRQAELGAQLAGDPNRRADRADRLAGRAVDRARRPARAPERRGAGPSPEA